MGIKYGFYHGQVRQNPEMSEVYPDTRQILQENYWTTECPCGVSDYDKMNHLLAQLLQPDPRARITMSQATEHPFFARCTEESPCSPAQIAAARPDPMDVI